MFSFEFNVDFEMMVSSVQLECEQTKAPNPTNSNCVRGLDLSNSTPETLISKSKFCIYSIYLPPL